MFESVFLAATGVLIVGSAWLFLRPRLVRSQDDLPPAARWKEESELAVQSGSSMPTHRAVSICPGAFCCQAVRQHEDQRFLSGDAPLLPVRDCDQATCECVYEHYDDRRGDEDRRNTFAAYSGFDPMQDKEERRDRKERRDR